MEFSEPFWSLAPVASHCHLTRPGYSKVHHESQPHHQAVPLSGAVTEVSQEATTCLLSPLPPHRSVSPGLFRPPWARPPGQDNTSSLLSKANMLLRTIPFSPVYRAQEVHTDGTCPHQPHWLPFHSTAEAIHIWKNVKSLM